MSSIWVYGDSWVYGAGEPGWKDTLDKYTNGHPNSWANQLASISDKKIINRGIPANNNLNIASQIVEDFLSFSKKDIIIVMWTSATRLSFIYNKEFVRPLFDHKYNYKTCTIVDKIIPPNVFTDNTMDINTAIAISSSLLLLKDFNFIFTSGFINFTIDNNFLITNNLVNKYSDIWIKKEGFQKLLSAQNLIRDCGHPNNKGHELIAFLMYKELIKRNFI
jgi:lysophospholipase L1-like esterase